VERFAFDPSDASVLYAANGALWRSADAGRTWSMVFPDPAKNTVEHGWGDQPVAEEQLYDLIFDPQESHNLAGDPEHSTVQERMRTDLEDWMRRTDDPLLEGPVPPPIGAEINLPSQGSSREPRTFITEEEAAPSR